MTKEQYKERIMINKLTYLAEWSFEMNGAMKAMEVAKYYFKSEAWRGDEAVYNKAEIDLAMSSKDNMWTFLSGGRQHIGYRNHIRNKNGKLISCEAFFVTK